MDLSLGRRRLSAGDLNCEGRADLLIGAHPRFEGGTFPVGKSYLVLSAF